MSLPARCALLAALSMPFLWVARALARNELAGRSLFTDEAAVPLALMGLGAIWVAVLLLLNDRLRKPVPLPPAARGPKA